jgi:uncharacterized protein
MVDYFALINKYYQPGTLTYKIFVVHAVLVTKKALEVARRVGVEAEGLEFIEEAAMLHDIGVVKVASEKMGCSGEAPYIAHGVCGREILLAEGLTRHAQVAARHVGVGLTKEEITARALPLPEEDLVPETLEEEIITYADMFFSKRAETLWQEESVAEIEAELVKFGQEQVRKFQDWHSKFGD